MAGDIQPDGNILWFVPPNPLVSALVLQWDDGTETSIDSLERPFILLDAKGRPSHLFAAASLKSPFAGSSQTPLKTPARVHPGNLPFNVCIPLTAAP